ncbi:Coenzyme F420 hydrogenase/dehydrogenase, beta subunit C-terminal domain [Cetobacterium sp. 2A]|uniref:Coenzyme F420 hydrogenase/dehydrogenase, beta subunit C-terminal domain n=1 Tax=Cetobacterium sp. 2A TaxID=2754723 RepID=UPI00163C19FC|nr:Coenzyme F420 hydrogenase/dehydrogenase, beta subunit C-terminal domain [Cetobacterium sp. 2A]MBC2856170.1 Coenzyme F420 hydrogenase/dehydrogenase, beta subunit C-terminal domain [Cetobacterium sp. 2A]
MKSAIETISYNRCTGCYGCLNICPVDGAIEFKKTEEGFYKPFLTSKCIQCGICQKGCPVITKINNNNLKDIKTYSCWSKDKEILKNSSSGGIFTELAKEFLKDENIVFGAKWFEGEIIHCAISKMEDLKPLQKSKYLQSKMGNSYKEAKKHLMTGKKVLFVGTPCQIAALNTIVKHENLTTVDIICHGVPSYKAFNKYIRESFNLDIKNIEVDFRNKDEGWESYNLIFKDKDKIITKNNLSKDQFFAGFLQDVYLNKPCYKCEFRTTPRQADITLGDFWQVPKGIKNFDGTSVVTVNNKKGGDLFEKIEAGIEKFEVDFETALKGNPCLSTYSQKEKNRVEFYENVDNMKFEELQRKYFPFYNPSFLRKYLGFIKRKIYSLYERLR